MASFYEKFVAFGVDNDYMKYVDYIPGHWTDYSSSSSSSDSAGLERLLRLFQSACLILTSYPPLVATLLPSSWPSSSHLAVETSLRQLQSRFNITRRWLRLFRFLEPLQAGWRLYRAENKTLEMWVDAHAKTCFGMFGLLESVTLFDLIDVDHLEIWGREMAVQINVDAQRFWFIALYLSALSSGIKLFRIFSSSRSKQEQAAEVIEDEKDAKRDDKQGEKLSVEEKVKEERKRRKQELAKINQMTTQHGLDLLASLLDLVIPASILGWVDVAPILVGLAMFTTSIITGAAVWKRSARQLEQRA
ncbi:Peroxisomal biogenesis factor 11 (PEX11) [Geosmithia morbida]|uniref:Peroxisomal biogenesis factor 11 (PEX11) n=1 Tax=Geosmithia morbida TaxID=1094350 RepID=A0A9P4YUN5_9HYPO|nr:Peroxisomal biogenesis factor 11 (PEX11) [Geosmithia morbida]KAF4122109.1 Peroxisomal biogenesis factor 11 (PEX11) [Geosmithia morbida]